MKSRGLDRTLEYLGHFETQLRRRSSSSVRRLMDHGPFYSMFAVGPYTVSPWKVLWRDMGDRIQVAVIGEEGGKPTLPEHHVMFVSFEGPAEAYYLCGALMSGPVQMVVASYTTTVGMSTHVLEHVAIPRFDPGNALHLRLADLSRQCHEAAKIDATETLKALEQQVDEAAAELWGLTEAELQAIQEALRDK